MIKGLELSRKYYEEYGFQMMRDKYPEYESRIAVGLVGQGSECYGFDDEISRDHDFGPSFCMWLTDGDYNSIGQNLKASYEELPKEFMGFKREVTSHGGGRVGIFRTGDFYRQFIGKSEATLNLSEWLYIPEHLLSAVTNGEVFRDDLGNFTDIRKYLLNYYPEDVRIKKIAARAAAMAQSGQYNYARSMRRGEAVAARLALDEFIRNAILIVYLLNRKYAPFYKWMHRGMEKLKILAGIKEMIDELVMLPMQRDAWIYDDSLQINAINMKDEAVVLIESICNLVVEELIEQGLTDVDETFLEAHTASIMSRIKDERLRNMHVMRG